MPAEIALTKMPDSCPPNVFITSNVEGAVNNVNTAHIKVHLYHENGGYMYKGIAIAQDGSFFYPLSCGTLCGALLTEKSWQRPVSIDWDTIETNNGILAIARGF